MWVFAAARLRQIGPMMKTLLIALVAFFAMAPAERALAAPRNTIDISNDSGGNVLQTIQRRNELARSGKKVRIRGYCRSACTIYLTLPNACLGPQASVGFHAPRIPGTRIIPPMVGDMMGQFYRGEIKRLWYSKWQYSLDMHRMSAKEYRRLDPQIRLCW